MKIIVPMFMLALSQGCFLQPQKVSIVTPPDEWRSALTMDQDTYEDTLTLTRLVWDRIAKNSDVLQDSNTAYCNNRAKNTEVFLLSYEEAAWQSENFDVEWSYPRPDGTLAPGILGNINGHTNVITLGPSTRWWISHYTAWYTLVHEYFHLLEDCSGTSAVTGVSTATHATEEVWEDAMPEAVEAVYAFASTWNLSFTNVSVGVDGNWNE